MKLVRKILVLYIVLAFACNKKNTVTPEEEVHCFYADFGTLPSFYAGLHVFTHNAPTYLYFERDMYDKSYFPAHVQVDIASGQGHNAILQQQMSDRVRAVVQHILRQNPKAKFELYTDDLRLRIADIWFWSNGVAKDKVKITLFSDGTGSYKAIFQDKFGNNGDIQFWNQYQQEFEQIYIQPSTATFIFDRDIWRNYSYVALSIVPQMQYWLQYPEYLQTNDLQIKQNVQKFTQEGKLIKKDLLDMYNTLSNNDQQKIRLMLRLAGTEANKYDALFSGDKPVLMITGTNPSNQQTLNYMQKVVDKFQADYRLLFKPHPADPNIQNVLNTFPVLSLVPATVPTEALFWFYNDKIAGIGGYESTLYLSVPSSKVKFFFLPGNKPTIAPLDYIWEQGVFSNVEIFNP